MRKLVLLTALALATPALAQNVNLDSVLGTSMKEVKASLTGMGYEVRKAEMEDGAIEVYAIKDGQMTEVYVDPQSGKVAKIKLN